MKIITGEWDYTAEEVANRYNVSREDQDEFAYTSHKEP